MLNDDFLDRIRTDPFFLQDHCEGKNITIPQFWRELAVGGKLSPEQYDRLFETWIDSLLNPGEDD